MNFSIIKYHIIYLWISLLILQFQHIVAKYTQNPISQFSVISSGDNIWNLQMRLSPTANKIAITYFNETQNKSYLKIFTTNDGSLICQNAINLLHGIILNKFSYQSGPILSYYDNKNNGYIPSIWNKGCKMQKQWDNIQMPSAFKIQISQNTNQNRGFVSFLTEKGIQQYDLYSKRPIQTYLTRQNFTFESYFYYSQNHQYLVALQSKIDDNYYVLTGFDTNTAKQVFSIEQKISPIAVLDKGTRILGFNQLSNDIYQIDRQGHQKMLVDVNSPNNKCAHKQYTIFDHICGFNNFYLQICKDQQNKTFIVNIFSTNPPQDKQDVLQQIYYLPFDKFGEINNIDCQDDKIAFMNEDGRIFVYQSIKPQQQASFPYIYIIIGGGVLVMILLIVGFFVIVRNKTKKNRINKQKGKQQSLLSQSQIDDKDQIKQPIIIVSDSDQIKARIMHRQYKQRNEQQQHKILNRREVNSRLANNDRYPNRSGLGQQQRQQYINSQDIQKSNTYNSINSKDNRLSKYERQQAKTTGTTDFVDNVV